MTSDSKLSSGTLEFKAYKTELNELLALMFNFPTAYFYDWIKVN